MIAPNDNTSDDHATVPRCVCYESNYINQIDMKEYRMELTLQEIILRIIFITIASGIIGFDREAKNRPAGMRTCMIVGIGATIVALTQKQIEVEAIQIALNQPQIAGIIRSDPARLICQVISGIGFLGAGTIIITKRSVMGLTTAASLWSVAGLGITIGMGYYKIALIGFIFIMLVLVLVQRFIHIPQIKRIEIQYIDPQYTKNFIFNYFESVGVEIKDADYDLDFSSENQMYTNIFIIELPKNLSYATIIEHLSSCENIHRIRATNL